MQSLLSRASSPGVDPAATATTASDSASSAASSKRRKASPFLVVRRNGRPLPGAGPFYTRFVTLSALSWASRPRDFVAVRGPDAADFLQRMVSNDVAALAPGEACDALLLTPKARVIAP